jgi:hypothetical protein
MINTYALQQLFFKIENNKNDLKAYKNEIADLIVILRLIHARYPLENIDFINNK